MNEEWNFEEKSSRSNKAVAVLIISFLIGLTLWAYFFPVVIYSGIFWVGAVLMGFPVYCAGEGLGSFGLDRKCIKSWPRFLRIIYGVIWVFLCMVIFIVIIGALSSMLVQG
jgi:hypothetical protein